MGSTTMNVGDLALVTSDFELEYRSSDKFGINYEYSSTRVGQLLLIIDTKLDRYIVQPTDDARQFFCMRWHVDTYAKVVALG